MSTDATPNHQTAHLLVNTVFNGPDINKYGALIRDKYCEHVQLYFNM